MSKIIALSKGKSAIVDDSDFEWLNQWKWYAKKQWNGNYYASRSAQSGPGQRTIYMHRIILGLDYGDRRKADHANMDTLDNRKSNLRIATMAQNCSNRGAQKNNTSGYKGVHWHKRDKIWQAEIRVDRELKHLGSFSNAEEAACVYDAAAKKFHGEFARLNFD